MLIVFYCRKKFSLISNIYKLGIENRFLGLTNRCAMFGKDLLTCILICFKQDCGNIFRVRKFRILKF